MRSFAAHLQEPHMPVLINKEVKTKELKAIRQCKECELVADSLQAFP